jgi:hypothetical protein
VFSLIKKERVFEKKRKEKTANLIRMVEVAKGLFGFIR